MLNFVGSGDGGRGAVGGGGGAGKGRVFGEFFLFVFLLYIDDLQGSLNSWVRLPLLLDASVSGGSAVCRLFVGWTVVTCSACRWEADLQDQLVLGRGGIIVLCGAVHGLVPAPLLVCFVQPPGLA